MKRNSMIGVISISNLLSERGRYFQFDAEPWGSSGAPGSMLLKILSWRKPHL